MNETFNDLKRTQIPIEMIFGIEIMTSLVPNRDNNYFSILKLFDKYVYIKYQ